MSAANNLALSLDQELSPGSCALELANAFIEVMALTDPAEIELTRGDVLLAAQHLYETVGPLRWERFTPRPYFGRIDYLSPHEREGVGLRLMGFFGWLVLRGLIDPEAGLSILTQLRDAAPRSPILADFHRCAELQIRAALRRARETPQEPCPGAVG